MTYLERKTDKTISNVKCGNVKCNNFLTKGQLFRKNEACSISCAASIRNINSWKNSEYRDKMSKVGIEVMSKMWEDPDYVKKMSNIHSIRMLECWKNTTFAKRRLSTQGNQYKYYDVHGIRCQGSYEKWYIEELVRLDKHLPKNCGGIKTPFGWYRPDFEYEDRYIEIKSNYTLHRPGQFEKIIFINEHPEIYGKRIEIINCDLYNSLDEYYNSSYKNYEEFSDYITIYLTKI